MKSTDSVKNDKCYFHIDFSTTGETQVHTILNIEQDISLLKVDKSIIAEIHSTGKRIIIETFSSEQSLNRAYGYLQDKIKRYRRLNKFSNYFKGFVKWVLLPIVGLVLVLAINASVALKNIPVQNQPVLQAIENTPIASTTNTTSSVQVPSQPVPTRQVPASSELAKALEDGIKTGDYSIPLSTSGKERLVVFSDPLCPHCKHLEPALEKLAEEFSVYVFPVSVIGGEQSREQITKVLCAAPDSRKALWDLAIEDETIKDKECPEGSEALASNEKIFKIMGFEGTPTLINGQGQQFPISQSITYESIKKWLAHK